MIRRAALLMTGILAAAAVWVAPPPADAGLRTFGTYDSIAVPDYSRITKSVWVTGTGGVITGVRATLNNLSHSYPGDLNIVLISPEGVAVPLMSDACGGGDLSGLTLSFTDAASTYLPEADACTAGTYRPTNYQKDVPELSGMNLKPTMAAFKGGQADGKWLLLATDDATGDVGSIAGGFTLEIQYAKKAAILINPLGKASKYPINFSVTKNAKIKDVNVSMRLWHPWVADLMMVLIGPHGQQVRLLASVCPGPVRDKVLIIDDQAKHGPPARGCAGGRFKPAGPTGIPLPGMAGSSLPQLKAFNNTRAKGVWKLYVYSTDDAGMLIEKPKLQITYR